jgi:predicted ester cyclase
MTDLNQANKQLVAKLWSDLAIADAASVADVFGSAMAAQVQWHGHAPVGSLVGIDAVVNDFWRPLTDAFTDMHRETHLLFGGQSNGRVDGDIDQDGRWWVTGTGLFHATFENDYLGIPASGEQVRIRWGEFCCVDGGVITEVYFLIDVVDLMRQAGFDVLPAARGADGLYPAPRERDGLIPDEVDSAVSAYSLDHIREFIFDGLNAYDEAGLESMGMADWFDADVTWYGPGGIGACLSFREFEELHQAPWLVAFPDRQVQNLDALFAEGMYSGAPGWAGVLATHTGPYLDQPATGRSIEFNGLDWWKRDGERYVENWVFVDMVHLFAQFGVDLFERLPVSR